MCMQAEGFSKAFIDSFFQPLICSLFADPQMTTSSGSLENVMKLMIQGDMAVPEGGMGPIALHLASQLPQDALLLGERELPAHADSVLSSHPRVLMITRPLINLSGHDGVSATQRACAHTGFVPAPALRQGLHQAAALTALPTRLGQLGFIAQRGPHRA